MKKILFRKLLLDYMSFFLIALISSSVIMWVFQAVNFLDIMIEDGRDYMVYISFSLLNFPKIFSKLYPFVLFFSLFYITIKYEANNELMIFWNFGINKIQIINFILKVSFFLMVTQLILTSIIVPKTQDLARSFLRSSTVNFLGNFVKPKKFNDTIKGVTIYSEKKDKNGNLFNLYLKKEIEENHLQITYAKKGFFKQTGNVPILVLYNGATITQKNDQITNFNFDRSDLPLTNFKSNTTTYKKTQEISTMNIFKCIYRIYNEKTKTSIENCSIENIKNIFKELYKRIIIPFYIPVLMLVPFLLITTSKENSVYSKLRFVTFLVGLFYIIFSETTIRLISEKVLINYFISIIPLVSLISIYIIFYKKFNFRKK
jgi:lipopolysaccharide export system permease protein